MFRTGLVLFLSYLSFATASSFPGKAATRAGCWDQYTRVDERGPTDLVSFYQEGNSPKREVKALTCLDLSMRVRSDDYTIDDIKEVLEREKISPNVTCNDDGWNILSLAASRGEIEKVRYLLSLGADPNLAGREDDWVRGALGVWAEVAVWDERDGYHPRLTYETGRLLIEAGADPNNVEFNYARGGLPVLHAVMLAGNPEDKAEVLISTGADVNLQIKEKFGLCRHFGCNYEGETPISIRYGNVDRDSEPDEKACAKFDEESNLKVIKFLHSKGANLNVSNWRGLSLLDRARICQHNQVANYLVENGAH